MRLIHYIKLCSSITKHVQHRFEGLFRVVLFHVTVKMREDLVRVLQLRRLKESSLRLQFPSVFASFVKLYTILYSKEQTVTISTNHWKLRLEHTGKIGAFFNSFVKKKIGKKNCRSTKKKRRPHNPKN